MSPINIMVSARGEVSDRAREQARKKVAELESVVSRPILGARVVLIQEANPRIPTPARAEAEIDVQGHLIRARVAAPSMDAAVDDVAERLRRHLRRYLERLATRGREPAQPPAGEWSHRSWSPPRSPTFLRPAGEREIIRRRTFAFAPMSVDDAVDALEDLDQAFLLFHDDATDADALVYWRDDGVLAMIEARRARPAGNDGPIREQSRFSAPIDLQQAVSEMDAIGHRFLFFEDAVTGRGNVIYRRYDGHYGLIEPG